MPLCVPPPVDPPAAVAVVAPAGAVKRAYLNAGIAILEETFPVRVDHAILETDGYLAGDDTRRASELQTALNAADVGAVLAARGGFGTTRILDRMDLTTLKQTPKWVVGCSDLTALLLHLYANAGLVTIHGPMVAGFHKTAREDVDALFQLLKGAVPAAFPPLVPWVAGEAKGPLIGGNLTVLAHMIGSLDPTCFEGAVLFLEDVGERAYRLERCLVQLSRAGVLDRISGVVIGELTHCESADETTAMDALGRVLTPLEVPVATGYPAAHGYRNLAFLHGADVTLHVSKDEAMLRYYL